MAFVIVNDQGRYANAQGAEVVWGSFANAQVWYDRDAADRALARTGGRVEELLPNNW